MAVEKNDYVTSGGIPSSLLCSDEPHCVLVPLDEDLVLLLDFCIQVRLRERRIACVSLRKCTLSGTTCRMSTFMSRPDQHACKQGAAIINDHYLMQNVRRRRFENRLHCFELGSQA